MIILARLAGLVLVGKVLGGNTWGDCPVFDLMGLAVPGFFSFASRFFCSHAATASSLAHAFGSYRKKD